MKAMKRQFDKAESKPVSRRLGDYFRQSSQKGREGLPLLSVTIADGMVGRESLGRKMDSDLAAEDHLLVRPGDLAYNMMRMWQGALAIADREGLVSPAYVVARPTEAIDPKFAGYFLKSARMLHHLWAQSYGLTDDRLRLYYKDFAMIRAEIPPLPEQRRIAEIISTWDASIEQTEKLVAAKERMKRGLMQRLLSGEPTKVRGGRTKRGRIRLGEVATINRETLSESTPPDFEFTYLDLGCVNTGTVEYPAQTIRFASSPSRARRIAREGDVVMATVRPNLQSFGRITDAPTPLIASTGFAVITCKEDCDACFVLHSLFSHHVLRQIDSLVAGSNYPAISASEVADLNLWWPSDRAERAEIADVLNTADAELTGLRKRAAALRRQRQGLMQVLLTGKLRVQGGVPWTVS